MITARNYAAQAERGLMAWAKAANTCKGMAADSIIVEEMIAKRIRKAVHFVLPDNGVLFDDDLRGIRNNEVRLPYPEITIEYFVDDSRSSHSDAAPCYAPKRFIHASEIPIEDIRKYSAPMMGRAHARFFDLIEGDKVILVVSANEYQGKWVPVACGWVLPMAWDKTEGTTAIKPIVESKKSKSGITGLPIVICPGIVDLVVKEVGGEDALRNLTHDIAGEVLAVLELCEALSCKNVSTENHQAVYASTNRKRIKAGKLPFYETKMLVINASTASQEKCGNGSGTHASPRQHLRRGHIRRLPIGNIWVNSCVVGDAKKGIIEKSYAVCN